MKNLILTIAIVIASLNVAHAEGFKIELSQGFATHYTKYHAYNDSVFKDSLTSTVTLLKASYNSYAVTTLSDSQGNMSFALTKDVSLVNAKNYSLNLVLGAYLIRSDKNPDLFAPEINGMLPTFSVGSRTWSVLPLSGFQADYHINKNLDATLLITPTFVLWGLKVKL